ncbi:hypothetical protein F5144DRAFT_631773 [Chaetomium tenue]|uniref:Uncharacterized protein n=1 Tax=Chaetomium tenue TaxID=1854479 RepID=A0ACB7P641_9PEZI|nr:hypothetical protein F5144DRAFT_631773 [Chaetomium globosum]
MPTDSHSETITTREDVLLAVTHLRSSTDELREVESQWEPTAMLLATEVFDKASDLGIDVDNIYDVEISLLENIELIETKLKQNYGSQWDAAARNLLYARETKLAALRDLSNTLDWVISPERAVVAEPRSSSVSDMWDLEAKIKTGKLQKEELENLHSQLLAAAIAVSGKTSSLQGEVRKVKGVVEILEGLHWAPDDAPLTATLLFN